MQFRSESLALCLTGLLAACTGMKPIDTLSGTDDDDGGTNFGELYLSPESVDFGEVTIDELSTADIVLQNRGTEAISVTDTLVSGDSVFTLESAVSLPMSLEAGAEAVVTVGFTPTTDVTYAGTFRVSVYGEDGYGSIALSGTGVEEGSGSGGSSGGGSSGGSGGSGGDDGLTLSATSVGFGTVDCNDGASSDVTITNNTSEDILITDLVSSEDAFVPSADFSTPGVLSVGETSTITIDFQPTAEVDYSGTITIETDPPEYESLISVTGRGLITCTVCQPIIEVDTGGTDAYSMSFGMFIATDGYSKTSRVTVSNTGDQDLEVSSVVVTNDSLFTCGTFSTDGSAMTIAPGGNDSFAVTYTVTESCGETANEGLDWNYLHIINNDPDQPDYAIALSALAL